MTTREKIDEAANVHMHGPHRRCLDILADAIDAVRDEVAELREHVQHVDDRVNVVVGRTPGEDKPDTHLRTAIDALEAKGDCPCPALNSQISNEVNRVIAKRVVETVTPEPEVTDAMRQRGVSVYLRHSGSPHKSDMVEKIYLEMHAVRDK